MFFSPAVHPLEPLSAAAIEASVQLLKKLPQFGAAMRIISIMLKEPAKELVYSWRWLHPGWHQC